MPTFRAKVLDVAEDLVSTGVRVECCVALVSNICQPVWGIRNSLRRHWGWYWPDSLWATVVRIL